MPPLYARCSFLLIVFLFSFALFAQSFSEGGTSCGADELRNARYATHPAYRAADERLEEQWAKHAQRPQRSFPPPYTLPIVFHIVHDNGPENISDADVIQSLEFTNQAFANTDYYDQGTGTPTGVQFCLAQRTPDNQATSGIDRVVAPEYVDLQATEEDRDMKDLARWNPREYVNVYIVGEICGLGSGCGVAGYAYYPGAHGGAVDGIVVEARWLSGDEADASVLVHELGHYLGIRHTFDGGCQNDDCATDGDRVCDTPPDQSKVAVPCSGSINTCTTDTDSGFATDQNDMFINYMDYGYWSCYSAFTQGQADRMHFFIGGIRASLLDSPGCLPPCPAVVTAGFTGGDVTVEAGTTVNFTNTSTNGNGFSWKIDGVTEAGTTDFSRLFDTEGTYIVTLVTDGSTPLCRTDSLQQRVRVICSLNAAFDQAGPTTLGEARSFPNLSTLADDYEWTVDGTPVSTDQDLTYTFPAAGLYNLCLEASNTFCEEIYCRLVFVSQPSSGGGGGGGGETCNPTFACAYDSPENEGNRGWLSASIPDENGGFYVGGNSGGNAIVMHVDEFGSVLWQQTLFTEGLGGIVKELIVDNDGMLAGIGQTNSLTPQQLNNQHFIFQLNPANGNLNWGRQYDQESERLVFETIIHPGPGLPYTIFGNEQGLTFPVINTHGIFLRVNTGDGQLAGDILRYEQTSANAYSRAVYQPGNNRYYVAGKDNVESFADWMSFTELDQDGGVITSTTYTSASNSGNVDLVRDGTGYALLSSSLTFGDPQTKLQLRKYNLNGNLLRSVEYSDDGPLEAIDLATNDTGYLILARTASNQTLLIQTDPAGDFLWSRILGIISFNGATVQPLSVEADGHIIIGGRAFLPGGGALPYLLKLRPDGTTGAGCIPNATYPLESAEIETESFDVTPVNTFIIDRMSEDFGAEPGPLERIGDSCVEECPDDEEDDCNRPFQLTFTDGNPEEAGTFTAVTTNNGLVYSAGRVGGLPYVQAAQPDGSILWQKNLRPIDGNLNDQRTITQLIIDDAGMLVGVGAIKRGLIERGGLAFRIDGFTGEMIWGFETDIPNQTDMTFVNIMDVPGSNTLLIGGNSRMDGITGRVAILLELDKNTGAIDLSGSRFYTNVGTLGFNHSILSSDNQTIYALGYLPLTGPWKVTVTAISRLSRNVQWSRHYLLNGTSNNGMSGKSLAELNGSLYFSALQRVQNGFFMPSITRLSLTGEVEASAVSPLPCNAVSMPLTSWRGRLAWMGATVSVGPCINTIDPTLSGPLATYSFDGVRDLPERPFRRNLYADDDFLYLALATDTGLPTTIAIDENANWDNSCLLQVTLPGQVSVSQQEVTEEEVQVPTEPMIEIPVLGLRALDSELEIAASACLQDCSEETEPDDDCPDPFLLAYDEGDAVTFGGFTSVLPVGTKRYVGGTINETAYVAELEADGTINWQTYFPAEPGSGQERDMVADLLMDSEGMLVGVIRKPREAVRWSSSIVKIDPTDGTITWRRAIETGPGERGHQFYNVFQPQPGGDYLVTGGHGINMDELNVRWAYYNFDRITGELRDDEYQHLFSTGNEQWHSNTYAGFVDAKVDEESQVLYATCNNYYPFDDEELGWLSAIDLTNNSVLFSFGFTIFNGNDQMLKFSSIAYHNGKVYGLGTLRLGPQEEFYIFNLRTDSPNIGVIRYTLDEPATCGQLEVQGDNLIVTGGIGNDQLVLEINANSGEVERGRRINSIGLVDQLANSCFVTPNRIFLAGERPAQGGVVVGSGLDGNFSDSCLPTFELLVPEDVPFGYATTNLDVPAIEPRPATSSELPLAIPGNLLLNPASCPTDCEPLTEICDNQIDDDNDGFVDCDDPDLATDCCCLDGPMPLLERDTVRCLPETVSISLPLGTRVVYTDETGTESDTLSGEQSWTLMAAGDYYWTYIDTCGRTAFDTLPLHPRPRPILELGPDTTLCSNAVIPLLAQPGFADYEWVDGSQERSMTAFEAGTYWVIATDSCGGTQTDTVVVTIDPATVIELGPDTLICPGDTIVFSLPGYTDYQWSESSFIDCTDCPTVRFAPTSDTLLLVAATQGEGCFSSDSIRIRVAETTGQTIETDLCSGDTLLLNNQAITNGGMYFDTVTSANCIRVDTLVVRGLSDTLLSSTVTICQGDSAMIFGAFETAPDTYQQSFARSNGCDSLVEITLSVSPAHLSVETLNICAGDSTAVFGNFESVAGTYEQNLPTAAGCDSITRVILEVNTLTIDAQVISEACLGAAAGAVEVMVSNPTPPYSILWSTGDTTARVNDLASGRYGVMVTDGNGCSVTDSLTVSELALPVIDLLVLPETCPGENDGSLTVSGELAGQAFSLNGAPFTTDVFYGNLTPGDYLLDVQDTNGCDQQFTFSLAGAEGLFLELPASITLPLGDSITLTPTTNAPDSDSLLWTSGNTILCSACPTWTVRPEATLEVVATLPDAFGCPVSAATTIRVTRDDLVYVPTAFSPNEDGVNDAFRIYPSAAVEEILRFAVYDRWGGEVFLRESLLPTDDFAGWDGTRPGGLDPTVGVYVYLVEVRLFNDEIVKLAGDVTLMR